MSDKQPWAVWSEDQESEEDARAFQASDAHNAVEQWAQWFDYSSGDYPISGGATEIVKVKGPDGEIRRFAVDGRMEPFYTSRELVA